MRIGPSFWLLLVLLLMVAPGAASAQECRRTCYVGEARDANGCCIARPTAAPGSSAPRPLPRRCPAGTTWSDSERACIGRLQCPVGSHPEEGGACVADAVGCPPGTRPEEGRCVADVTCPANARLENNVCITDVTCPPGTRLESGRCLSSEVQCPEGTRAHEGGGCVGDPVCPEGTRFVEGQGCVGEVVCPRGSHNAGGACVPDVVCLEGTRHVEGQGCVDVCAGFPHARWESERRACTCEPGFTAREGRCVEATCEAGMRREEGRCVPEVVCPYGYQFQRGVGCVDRTAEERVARERAAAEQVAREEAAQRARVEEERRASRWAMGPSLQLWAGGGYGLVMLPGVFNVIDPATPGRTPSGDVRWQDVALSGGLAYTSRELVLAASYTRIAAMPQSEQGFRVTPEDLHLVLGEIGQQGAGRVHAWRFALGAGYGFGANVVAASATYRSLFRLVAGLFVGIEVRALGLFRVAGLEARTCREVAGGCIGLNAPQNENTVGYGGSGMLFLGYSIH